MTDELSGESKPTGQPSDAVQDAVLAELRDALAPRIQVLSRLGAGGMAEVYLGRDPLLRRSLAIKVMSREYAGNETARTRFTREAQAIAAINHPNVINIYDVGELPSGTPYFLMQLVEGRSLETSITEDGPSPQGRAKRLIGETAAGLAAAHARGLVHRDIKPANVLLDAETDRAIVVDFGISSALDSQRFEGSGTLTMHGSYVGTPTYTSPEQASGEKVTGKSDVYSLGILAFELLTGKVPFTATTPMALLASHIKDDVPPLRDKRPDLDVEFTELIERCLAKDPADRPEASEVAAFLVPTPQVAVEWPPPGLEELRGQGARMSTAFSVVGGLVAAFLLVLLTQPSIGTAMAYQAERSTIWSMIGNSGVLTSTINQVSGDGLGFATQAAAQSTTPQWLMLLVLTLVGAFVALVVCVTRAARLAVALRSAQGLGYPALVLVDVAMDSAPDTVELRNGSGRFAILSQAARDSIARARRLATFSLPSGFALTSLLAAAWALGALPIGGGSTQAISTGGALVLLFPTVAGGALSVYLALSELRLRGRGWTRSGGTARVRPEFVADWLERSRTPNTAGRRWSHLLVPAVGIVGGILAVMAMYLSITATVVATSSVMAHRITARSSDRLLPTGVSRFLEGRLDSLPRPSLLTPGDSQAGHLLAAGYFLFRSNNRSFGARAQQSADRMAAVAQLVRADTLLLPVLGYPDSSTSVQPENPWLTIWRRFGRTDAGAGPFLQPTPAVLELRARWAASPNFSFHLRPLLSHASHSFNVRMRGGDLRGARDIALESAKGALRLLRSPTWEEYSGGVLAANAASRMLATYATAAKDSGLGRRAREIELSSRSTFLDYLELVWAFAGNVHNPALVLEAVGTPALRPSVRWNTVGFIVDGFCSSAREIGTGVSPRRLALLDSAEQRLRDIPRSDEWVAAHKARLTRLIDSPEGMGTTASDVRFATWVLKPVAWMGLRGMYARMTYCLERRDRVW